MSIDMKAKTIWIITLVNTVQFSGDVGPWAYMFDDEKTVKEFLSGVSYGTIESVTIEKKDVLIRR